MDPSGASELSRRIEEQEHWQQAAAVRAGQLPRVDPDRLELTGLGYGVRHYGTEQRHEVVDGRRSLVTFRVCKRLRMGAWERELVREDVLEFG